MKKQSFEFDVIFTKQDEGGFTVEVPDLPGCISEGDTIEEAEENIQEAIELYLKTLEDRGLPLPQREESKIFKMKITVERKSKLKKLCHA
jgi:predicted RNase H-like HicB family nuclease